MRGYDDTTRVGEVLSNLKKTKQINLYRYTYMKHTNVFQTFTTYTSIYVHILRSVVFP